MNQLLDLMQVIIKQFSIKNNNDAINGHVQKPENNRKALAAVNWAI